MNPYTNSGPLVVTDLKKQLWRIEEEAWIDTGIKECAFMLPGLPRPGETKVRESDRTYMTNEGRIFVRPGYIYDGSSVPLLGRFLDRRVSQWPGTVHDIGFEAFRCGSLSQDTIPEFNALYRDMLRAFGSFWLTSRICHLGLRLFGGSSAERNEGSEYPRRVAP